jgi:hypothetical protein
MIDSPRASENSDADLDTVHFDANANIPSSLRVEKDHTICDLSFISKISRLLGFAKK